jgi:TolB protein
MSRVVRNGLILMMALTLWGGLFLHSSAEEALLESTRPDTQKIPIHVMDFVNVDSAKKSDLNRHDDVTRILKADLTRSQVFLVVDLPLAKGEFSENKCVGLSPVEGGSRKGTTLSTWGRLGLGGPSSNGQGLIFDACADDTGHQDYLFGKRYFSMKMTEPLLRLMTHRWADELVYRYTGEQGIAQTKIAYVAEEGLGKELFVMDYDGYGPQQVTADGYLNLMPTWASDRKSLVFTAYRQRKQLIIQRELSTGKEKTLVPAASLNITPSFSQDGRSLVYSSARNGNSDIYKLEIHGKAIERLTSHRSADLSPSWSPDGTRLAFTSDRGGRPQVYTMNADGSNVRRLTYEGDYNAAPVWSPQGDWIAYVCRIPGQYFKLCRISPDGRQVFQITKGRSIDDSPSWSPNGRHLVFSSLRRGKSQIYMVNSDGTALEQLTSGAIQHSSPSWSPY